MAETSLRFFMTAFAYTETGEKFSFAGRNYLLQPYLDNSAYQVHKKCTQVGITTKALFSAIHACMYNKYPKGCIYFFPTETDVNDFSRGRVAPIIENNSMIANVINDTDTVGMKRVGKRFIYFRGMKSKSRVKSVPSDKNIYDELDEMSPEIVEMAHERLGDSTLKYKEFLSNPTFPEYGIDKEFITSDQKHWLLKCPHCGEWNCLEETFPKCILPKGDTYILACKKCRKELDKCAGEWVAKMPRNKDVSGYQYSQLFSKNVTPKEIYTKYHKALKEGKIATFTRLVLGLAYVSAKDRLTKEQVLKLRSNEFPKNFWELTSPLYMGVDQGKDLHCVFKRRWNDIILTYPIVEVEFEDLDKYIKRGVMRCVIDALPETRKAKELSKRFPGKVYINYYTDQKTAYNWKEDIKNDEYIVQENRTDSMDASHELILNGEIMLPFTDVSEEYAIHCYNTAKKEEENKETGKKRNVWVKLGADHFRHADNFATIAMSREDEDANLSVSSGGSNIEDDIYKGAI